MNVPSEQLVAAISESSHRLAALDEEQVSVTAAQAAIAKPICAVLREASIRIADAIDAHPARFDS